MWLWVGSTTVRHTLKLGTAILDHVALSPSAQSVFLLDAHRRDEGRKILPDEFDNRSVCFTTDFPAANLLAAQQIGSVLLVQRTGDQPQLDIAHILRRKQQLCLAASALRPPPDACDCFVFVGKTVWNTIRRETK